MAPPGAGAELGRTAGSTTTPRLAGRCGQEVATTSPLPRPCGPSRYKDAYRRRVTRPITARNGASQASRAASIADPSGSATPPPRPLRPAARWCPSPPLRTAQVVLASGRPRLRPDLPYFRGLVWRGRLGRIEILVAGFAGRIPDHPGAN